MVKRMADMEKQVREKMRGGKGQVEILHIFRQEELKGKMRLLARLRLAPGSSIGYHVHEGEEEIFYILSGTGRVTEQGVSSRRRARRCRAHRRRRRSFHRKPGRGSAGAPRHHPDVLKQTLMILPFFRRRGPAERIATSFRWLEEKPLPEARAAHYAAATRGAPIPSPSPGKLFRLGDAFRGRQFTELVLEADVELDPSNGHSAAGVLFRHVNDENFYSFLVSSRGNFRVDLLFNNHPMHLVEWTRLPEIGPGAPTRGGGPARARCASSPTAPRFTFIVDDEWVGEVEDEVLPSGGSGLRRRTSPAPARGVFRLRRLLVEARPLAVEKEHLRWWYYVPVSPRGAAATGGDAPRRRRAQRGGRAASQGTEGPRRQRRASISCSGRVLHAGSPFSMMPLPSCSSCSRWSRHTREARMEKANLLYLSNRIVEARDCLRAGLADGTIAAGCRTLNLLGNAEYALGNWEKAAEAYRRATELHPDAPLFLRNAARSLERAGHAERGRGPLPARRAAPLCRGGLRRAFPRGASGARPCPGKPRGPGDGSEDALPRGKDGARHLPSSPPCMSGEARTARCTICWASCVRQRARRRRHFPCCSPPWTWSPLFPCTSSASPRPFTCWAVTAPR